MHTVPKHANALNISDNTVALNFSRYFPNTWRGRFPEAKSFKWAKEITQGNRMEDSHWQTRWRGTQASCYFQLFLLPCSLFCESKIDSILKVKIIKQSPFPNKFPVNLYYSRVRYAGKKLRWTKKPKTQLPSSKIFVSIFVWVDVDMFCFMYNFLQRGYAQG